jgi:hypothetical protein
MWGGLVVIGGEEETKRFSAGVSATTSNRMFASDAYTSSSMSRICTVFGMSA